MEARLGRALFDKIEGFAGYGFNKSHSVEYTLISYQVDVAEDLLPGRVLRRRPVADEGREAAGILKDAACAS
jgi:DNA polymerase-3 subunit alpha